MLLTRYFSPSLSSSNAAITSYPHIEEKHVNEAILYLWYLLTYGGRPRIDRVEHPIDRAIVLQGKSIHILISSKNFTPNLLNSSSTGFISFSINLKRGIASMFCANAIT